MVFSANRGADWEREPKTPKSQRRPRRGKLTAAPQASRAPTLACGLDRWQANRVHRIRRPPPGLPGHASVRDEPDGGYSRVSADLDRDVEETPSGRRNRSVYIQFTVDDGVTQRLATSRSGARYARRRGGRHRPRPALHLGVFTVARMAASRSRTPRPSSRGCGHRSARRRSRLTALNDDLFGTKTLGAVRELTWKSSNDKRKVQGWIVKPPDFDPRRNIR